MYWWTIQIHGYIISNVVMKLNVECKMMSLPIEIAFSYLTAKSTPYFEIFIFTNEKTNFVSNVKLYIFNQIF